MDWLNALLLVGHFAVASVDVPTSELARQELQRFQGHWQPASIRFVDGTYATKAELKETRLMVYGTRFILVGKAYTASGTFVIDPTKSPKTIDVLLDGKNGAEPIKALGIYRIEGDKRWSCLAMPNEPRPGGFVPARKQYLRLEWERAASSPK